HETAEAIAWAEPFPVGAIRMEHLVQRLLPRGLVGGHELDLERDRAPGLEIFEPSARAVRPPDLHEPATRDEVQVVVLLRPAQDLWERQHRTVSQEAGRSEIAPRRVAPTLRRMA